MIAVLTPLMATLGPLAVLLLMAVLFAETGLLVGFFLPGDSLLFAAGVLVAAGAMHLPLWMVAAGALVAAGLGDQVGYLVGRWSGPRIFNRPESRLFSRRHVDRAHAFFDRHGPRAVILARFVPVVRTFTPVVAGVGRMSRRRFTVYNLVGAATWAVGLLVAGFFLGGVPVIADHIELVAVGLASLSVVPASIAFARRRARRRASYADRSFGMVSAGPAASTEAPTQSAKSSRYAVSDGSS